VVLVVLVIGSWCFRLNSFSTERWYVIYCVLCESLYNSTMVVKVVSQIINGFTASVSCYFLATDNIYRMRTCM